MYICGLGSWGRVGWGPSASLQSACLLVNSLVCLFSCLNACLPEPGSREFPWVGERLLSADALFSLEGTRGRENGRGGRTDGGGRAGRTVTEEHKDFFFGYLTPGAFMYHCHHASITAISIDCCLSGLDCGQQTRRVRQVHGCCHGDKVTTNMAARTVTPTCRFGSPLWRSLLYLRG